MASIKCGILVTLIVLFTISIPKLNALQASSTLSASSYESIKSLSITAGIAGAVFGIALAIGIGAGIGALGGLHALCDCFLASQRFIEGGALAQRKAHGAIAAQ